MLLQKLQEELAESIVEASKCQNFGLHETYGNATYNQAQLSNVQRLRRELLDVVAVCDMLEDEPAGVPRLLERDDEAITAKRSKVETYLRYSQTLGIMEKTRRVHR
jgi:hypothetical protein